MLTQILDDGIMLFGDGIEIDGIAVLVVGDEGIGKNNGDNNGDTGGDKGIDDWVKDVLIGEGNKEECKSICVCLQLIGSSFEAKADVIDCILHFVAKCNFSSTESLT